jgi:hypothetical protein
LKSSVLLTINAPQVTELKQDQRELTFVKLKHEREIGEDGREVEQFPFLRENPKLAGVNTATKKAITYLFLVI